MIEINEQLLYKSALQIAQENNKFKNYGNQIIDSSKKQFNYAKSDFKTLVNNLKYSHKNPSLGFLGGNAFSSFGAELPIGGWKELDRTTLGSANDNINVGAFTSKKHYHVLGSVLNSGAIDVGELYGNTTIDTGANYTRRRSDDGAADTTSVSANSVKLWSTDVSYPIFWNHYLVNLAGNEKLGIFNTVGQNAAGEANVPLRTQGVVKWVETTNLLDIYRANNGGSGSFNTASEVVILEWDPTDIHTDNFWEELGVEELSSAADTITLSGLTTKKYLWVQIWMNADGSDDIDPRLQVNADTDTIYADRLSSNGAADTTGGNLNRMQISSGSSTDNFGQFVNLFIINISGQEKLIIANVVGGNTAGAANLPERREGVHKVNLSAQISQFNVINATTGNFKAGSFIKAWGAN